MSLFSLNDIQCLQEKQFQKYFLDETNDYKNKSMDLARVNALFHPLMLLLISSSILLVVLVGGIEVSKGNITHGNIAEFIIYVNMLTWPVAAIGWVTSLVQEAEASQKRINEFLKEKPEIINTSTHRTPIEGAIEFNNVTFDYPDTNIRALNGISFRVDKGKTLAIIGKTGSGKSTILDLIGRLYDINEGSIKIDGKPIEQLHLTDLRNAIGYVPQDAFLFSDTIKNNIKFGDENASDDVITAAAKDAVVHENIIRFNKGYDTILGERGITLSGGQKQRISIARAIIKQPQILLLDDCLSAVDTETEEEILNNLKKVTKDKTTIIVSHRISSAKNADQIIVLEDGKIIQEGTHDILINIDGYYKDLYLKPLSETSAH